MVNEPMCRPDLPVFQSSGIRQNIAAVLDFARHRSAHRRPAPGKRPSHPDRRAPCANGRDVELAIEAYRYQRDLVSAEECETWLAARGLHYADLQTALARRLDGTVSSDPEQQQIDFLISSDFDRGCRALAHRMAALAALGRPPMPADDDRRDAVLEAAFVACCAQALSDPARRRALEPLRWRLTKIELDAVEFDQFDAAQEARCCVLEDALPLRELARQEGYPAQARAVRVEALPEAWQHALRSTPAGNLVGPLWHAGRHWLLAVSRQQPPELDDGAVRQRIDQHLLGNHFDALLVRHIEWIMPRLEVSFEAAEVRWGGQ